MSSGSSASSIHANYPVRRSTSTWNRSDPLSSQTSVVLQPHRALLQHTRASKPPTSGPSTRHRPTRSFSESSSKSMPGELSNFFGNVKRSFSVKKNEPSQSSTYYGITPEEDAARVQGYQPQRPLMPPPTFQQIASGLAVPNTRHKKQRSSPLPPPPSRSSLKPTPTNRSSESSNHATVILTHSKLFSASSPSLALSNASSPNKGHNATFLQNHIAPSSSASSFTNSTSSSSFARMPFKKKHKLALSISTITGRRPVNGGSGSTSPTDSSLSLGKVSSISDGRHSRKAVRFSESHDREPSLMQTAAMASSTPGVAMGDVPRIQIEAIPRHSTSSSNSSNFVERTARFFGR